MALSPLRRRLESLWYPGADRARTQASLLLRGAEALYARALERRARSARPPEPLPVPCICVGNLTVGGAGKTPLVAWIVEALLGAGARPGVISRGYGGAARGPARVPAAGGAAAAAAFGDEPAWLASRFPGVPVVVGRDRVAAGRLAVREGAGVVVADDAFQHRRLARDLDVVTVDAARGFGNGRLLPAGPLREPLAGLGRAGVVVIRGAAEDAARLEAAVARLSRPGAAVVVAATRFAGLREAFGGAPVTLPPGAGVTAFAGIAAPERLVRTLEGAGLRVLAWEAFPDHHRFRGRELRRLAGAPRGAGALAAVTTAKDAVRIAAWPGPAPLYRAEVDLAIIKGCEELWRALETSAAAARG